MEMFVVTPREIFFPRAAQAVKCLLLGNLEGWDGVRGEREFQEEGDICKPMADSCWCMAEIITIL